MTSWMKFTGEDTLQLVRIRDDAFGYADLKDGFLRLIVIEGEFEKDFFRIADFLLGSGGTFLDIGANHGLLSLGLAGKFADCVDFHLFEPNPGLRDSFERSRLRYPTMRATLNAEALAEWPGSLQIKFYPEHLGMSHVVAEGGTTVNSIRLDDYLSSKQITKVELMKVDVEGYEAVVLHGAERSLKAQVFNAIYFEYCEKWLRRNGDPGDLLAYLRAHDYEPCLVRDSDLASYGGATHRIAGPAGGDLPLRPLAGDVPPETTDMLAVPLKSLLSL